MKAYPLALVAAAVLVAALLLDAGEYHPYGYYQWLRIATCGMCAVYAYVLWHVGKRWARSTAILAGLVAVIFNPVLPVTMTKGNWQPIDKGAAVFVLLAGSTAAAVFNRVKFGVEVISVD